LPTGFIDNGDAVVGDLVESGAMTAARRFTELQRRLVERPPGRDGATARTTAIALPSMNLGDDYHAVHDTTALEERWLYLLLLLADPALRVVAITSAPVPASWVDFYLGLLPDPAGARARLTVLDAGDPTPGVLAGKVLAQPAVLERLRAAVGDPHDAYVVPFNVEDTERDLALALDVPVYGVAPAFARYGTKSGGRRLLADAGVAVPDGAEDLRGEEDVAVALAGLRTRRPELARAVIKLDEGTLGQGNAIVALDGAAGAGLAAALTPEYRAALTAQPAVIEALVDGDETHSPSVQVQVTPAGEVRVLGTHDQVLAGPLGHTFAGARFPADPRYGPAVTADAVRVGERLAAEGMVGRFALDFVVARDGDAGPWTAHAVDLNLREGGTTHPLGVLELLTGGAFDTAAGVFVLPDGSTRAYEATDRLYAAHGESVDPDRFLAALAASGLAWDRDAATGVVPFMPRALERAGRAGIVAVARTAPAAAQLRADTGALLDGLR